MYGKIINNNFRKSILIILILIIIIVSFSVVGYMSYMDAKEDLTVAAKDNLKLISYEQEKDLELYLKNYESLVSIMSEFPLFKEYDENSLEKIYEIFEHFKKMHPEIRYIYIGTPSENLYIYPKIGLGDNYTPITRPWYIKAIEENNVVWTDIYESGDLVIMTTVAIPIYKNGEIIGVLGVDLSLEELTNQIEIQAKGLAKTMVIDSDGNILRHTDKVYEGINDENLAKLTSNTLETKSFSSIEDNNNLIIISKTLNNLGLTIATYITEGSIEKESTTIINNTIIVAMLSFVIISIALYFTLRFNNKYADMKTKYQYDDLTGIYNRRHILDFLDRQIINAQNSKHPLLIIMFDIDSFKKINDNYGHLIGDEVLIKVCEVIKDNIRKTDFFGRYGGDEFLIILPGVEFNHGKCLAEKLRVLVSNIEYKHKDLKSTISIGLCSWKGESTDQFIDKADELLYLAKESGKNNIKAKE